MTSFYNLYDFNRSLQQSGDLTRLYPSFTLHIFGPLFIVMTAFDVLMHIYLLYVIGLWYLLMFPALVISLLPLSPL